MTRRSLVKSIAGVGAFLVAGVRAFAAKPVTLVITVTTAGTPVQVTASTLMCNTILFNPLTGNVGTRCYVGDSASFSKTTGAGLISPTPFSIASQVSSNPWNLADYWVDADTSGDKVSVTYWQL